MTIRVANLCNSSSGVWSLGILVVWIESGNETGVNGVMESTKNENCCVEMVINHGMLM